MLRFDLSLKALSAQRWAMETTQHNIANADTPGYTRQKAQLQAAPALFIPGVGYLGQGIETAGVGRQNDSLATGRVQQATQVLTHATAEQDKLRQIETVLQPGQGDLVSSLGKAMDNLQNLISQPEDSGLRTLFTTSLGNATTSFHELDTKLQQLQSDSRQELDSKATSINNLGQQIARLNRSIMASPEPPNDLLDQREELVRQLSELADVRVSYSKENSAQVVLGNSLLVDKTHAMSIEAADAGNGQVAMRYQGSSVDIRIGAGAVAGIMNFHNNVAPAYIAKLDTLAQQFMTAINRLHATGNGLDGAMTQLSAESTVSDVNQPLNAAGFAMKNGTLTVSMREAATGSVSNYDIAIAPDTDTMQDMVVRLSAIPNLNASVDANGRLQLQSVAGYGFAFASDGSDFLAEVGLNTLLRGSDAGDIAVTARVSGDAKNLALAKTFAPGNSDNARAMLQAMQNDTYVNLGDMTLSGFWNDTIAQLGAEVAAKGDDVEIATQVLNDWTRQREQAAGVSLDEELIQLKKFQHGYEAAARVFQTVDEMMQTAINL
jgi:flagellar hook-associated protein 1 FlgK